MTSKCMIQKCLPLKSAKHAFLRGETSSLSRKGPCCKALLRLKRDPYVRQNLLKLTLQNGIPAYTAYRENLHPRDVKKLRVEASTYRLEVR